MSNGILPGELDDVMLARLQERSIQYDTNCHRVGKIVAFNKNELTCDVELLELQNNVLAGAQSFAILKQLPLIIDGTDSAHLTWGNIVGSECLVHFNDRDIDNWFETGEAYEPNTTRMHNFSDGFVTLRPFSKVKVFQYDDEAVVLQNQSSKIRITGNTVQITNGSFNFLISGDTMTVTGNIVVDGDITATGTITSQTDVIAGTISGKSHTHGGVTGGSGNTGVPQ